MAKKNIHPDYHLINVTATNGQVFQTRSTYGKDGAALRLDIDPHNHPAWTGNFVVRNVGRAATFNQKYSAWAKATEKK